MKKLLSKLCGKLGNYFEQGHRLSSINRSIFFYTLAIKLGEDRARFWLFDRVMNPTYNLSAKAKDASELDLGYFWFTTNKKAALRILEPLIENGAPEYRVEAAIAYATAVFVDKLYKDDPALAKKAFFYIDHAVTDAKKLVNKNTFRGKNVVDRACNTLGGYYAWGIGTKQDTTCANNIFEIGAATPNATCCKDALKWLKTAA